MSLFLCLQTLGQPLSSPAVQLRAGQTIARLFPVPLWQQVAAWAACCQSTWATSSTCLHQAWSLWCWRGSCSSPCRWRGGVSAPAPGSREVLRGTWATCSPTGGSGPGGSRGAARSKAQELLALATLQFCTNTIFQIRTLGRDLAPQLSLGGRGW